jgi:hypothetical protein
MRSVRCPLYFGVVLKADGLLALRVSDAGGRRKVFDARTAVVMSRAMGKAVLR